MNKFGRLAARCSAAALATGPPEGGNAEPVDAQAQPVTDALAAVVLHRGELVEGVARAGRGGGLGRNPGQYFVVGLPGGAVAPEGMVRFECPGEISRFGGGQQRLPIGNEIDVLRRSLPQPGEQAGKLGDEGGTGGDGGWQGDRYQKGAVPLPQQSVPVLRARQGGEGANLEAGRPAEQLKDGVLGLLAVEIEESHVHRGGDGIAGEPPGEHVIAGGLLPHCHRTGQRQRGGGQREAFSPTRQPWSVEAFSNE